MKLKIYKSSDITRDFIKFLVNYISIYAKKYKDDPKLISIGNYINDNVEELANIKISKIVEIIFDNLAFTEDSTVFTILINPIATFENTNIKIIDVAKLINYGNLEIRGYMFITETFEHINSMIDFIYKMYKN